ncbi:MAG: V-type ATP synthase subunit E [Actinomycetota bacterium]|nr:V-type ATP synthase subunit E [Actinomycetota bacterium]
MALEDIFRALEVQADQECDQIVGSARDQADAIISEAGDQAEAIREGRIEDAERVTRQKAMQSVNAAKLESKKRVAAVKQQAVADAFKAALEELGKVRSSSNYAAILRALVEEAAAGVEGELDALVDPADAGIAASTFADLGINAEIKSEITSSGGVIIRMAEGRIMRRNTLEDRLEKVEPSIQSDVAEILFS